MSWRRDKVGPSSACDLRALTGDRLDRVKGPVNLSSFLDWIFETSKQGRAAVRCIVQKVARISTYDRTGCVRSHPLPSESVFPQAWLRPTSLRFQHPPISIRHKW
jgi:hypothetical protein